MLANNKKVRSMAWLLTLSLAGAAACGGGSSPRTLARASNAGTLPAELVRLNAQARAEGVVDTRHGLRIADPYRALERDTPATRAWVEAQTARTLRALDPLQDPATRERLRALLSIGFLDGAEAGGDRLFVTLREGTREQPALFRMEAGKLAAEPLIDPLRDGPRAALDYSFVAPDGRHVAFGISENGDERAVLQVVNVDRAERLPERIEHAKWCSLSWLNDGSGFYYTRYPRDGEPRFDPAHPDSYFPAVFFHRLGSDPTLDVRVFESTTGTDFPYAEVGDDDRHVLLGNYRGWTASDLYLLDRGAEPASRVAAPDPAHPLLPIVTGLDKLTHGTLHRGRLLLFTNIDAPKNRIVSAPLTAPGDRSAWRDLVPESSAVLGDWSVTRERIAVHVIEDIQSRLRLYTLDGQPAGEVPLPGAGELSALDGLPNAERLHFVFSSLFTPPTLYAYDIGAGSLTRLHQVAHDLDTSAYALSRASVPSADGTPINVFYAHRRDLALDADNPVLLTGYGGFDVALLPSFARSALYWLERGGVYAVANLRGGGEYGEAWHRAGMLEHKPRVFEDFEAVLAWLSTSRISRPERIAITGGSNGGLLMGAMITRVPERFAAATAHVGLYDMTRYTEFPPAALWTSEYGDPSDPTALGYLLGYSPYHQVRAGTPYPALLIETADHDTRVHWAHSTKFAAALQDATGSSRPIYFHMERAQGHGHGTSLSDRVRETARKYAFVERALGMR
jgi:prolyl oligopeptidase